MPKFEWPYVDPEVCEREPARKGLWKLCPRCSVLDKICCGIVPDFTTDGGFRVSLFTLANNGTLERQIDGTFPNAEDYVKYKWVCSGGCDAEGKHRD